MTPEINPPVIYRYQSDGLYGLKMLLEQQLYFSPPDKLNDPFEGTIRLSHEGFTLEELRRWFGKMIDYGWPNLSATERAAQIEIDLVRALKNDRAELKEKSRQLHENLAQYTGIISLSCSTSSPMLWSHYADGHRGFRVGFYSGKLFELTRAFMGEVSYTTNFPTQEELKALDLPDDADELAHPKALFIKAFTKHKDWEVEQEFRAYREPCHDEDDRLVFFPSELVESVAFGCKMSADRRRELTEACRNLYPHATLYEEVRSPNSFEFTLAEVDL